MIGLVFGLGLVIAGMSNPAKVLNFLDIAGGVWDPSLAFVMVGGIAVTAIGFRLVLRLRKPILDLAFHLPTATRVDARVVAGPAIFGIGWGLAGFCPGPAFTALSSGSMQGVLFVAAMMAGMGVARRLTTRPATQLPAAARHSATDNGGTA
ncbi:DUF6691 family protein [Roseomonas sp. CAU 1739]|uniref:DUF6691 family protein n=1 Tax=Roseomonas sp. CAU 1739 TaxID=3140364 RepID=UPI0038D080BD